MRVLLMSRNFPPNDGGVATYFYHLALEMYRQGDFVLIFTAKTPNSEQFDKTQPLIIKRLHRAFFWSPIWTLYLVYNVIHYQIDHIINLDWRSGIHTWFTYLYKKTDFYTVVHGLELIDSTYSFKKKLWKSLKFLKIRVLKSSRVVFPNSNFTASILNQLGVINFEVVHPGVDPLIFLPLPKQQNLVDYLNLESSKIILSVSRLSPHKGQDLVIRSMPKIIKEVGDVKFLIVGQGEYQKTLALLTRSCGVSDSVIFAGYVHCDDLVHFYNLADVFVLLSRQMYKPARVEGFGIALLEAQACEKPVVGGYSGGIPDAIIDGYTGFLVTPYSTDDCASAIIEILKNKEMGIKMGKNGRKRVLKHLTWSVTAKKIRNAMQSDKHHFNVRNTIR